MQITPDEFSLLKELAEQFDYPTFDPEIHVTLEQLADMWGLSKNGARNRMDGLCMDGHYKKITVRRPEDNRQVTAYKKP